MRKLAGINFVGETSEERAVIGDVELTGLDDRLVCSSIEPEYTLPDLFILALASLWQREG